jgi:hypothetical protein
MPLILKPDLSDLSAEEIEEHLMGVRARRMVGAVEYIAGKNMKLSYESVKIQKKVQMEYERLGRAINKLDAADELVQKHLLKIEELKSELGFTVSQVITDEEEEAA